MGIRIARPAILAAALALVSACSADPLGVAGGATRATLDALADEPWSAPVNLGGTVNSSANEQNAILSRDGLTLYFASDRPGGVGALDIWVARRASADDPWTTPVNLAAINTPFADFAPALSPDGHLLFFASNRPGGAGNNDLYVAMRSNPQDDLSWGTAAALGAGVNTADAENAPFFMQSVEDGPTNLYFNRGNLALNRGDIWSAAIDRDGTTSEPATLVAELSVFGANDAAPSIRKDGREAFFFSNRPGTLGPFDIYQSTRLSVHHPWSVPSSVAAINTTSNEVTPSLSHDGRTLIFASGRPGGLGGNDLWITSR
jgi:Tol biopolymer transport system component